MITNNYMQSRETHAAYTRKTGTTFRKSCARRADAMPIEADELEARLATAPAKEKPYMKERIQQLRDRAPGVRAMGENFERVFHASADRILAGTGPTDPGRYTA